MTPPDAEHIAEGRGVCEHAVIGDAGPGARSISRFDFAPAELGRPVKGADVIRAGIVGLVLMPLGQGAEERDQFFRFNSRGAP